MASETVITSASTSGATGEAMSMAAEQRLQLQLNLINQSKALSAEERTTLNFLMD
jgi:hypothetical protein